MNDRDKKKKNNPGALIVVGVLLLLRMPELIVPVLGLVLILAIIASPFLIIRFSRKNKNRSPATGSQKEAFDDCPKPFCFHKDKGEHHVRRGREIDPWDRPDIDISKYQRRQ